MRCSRASRNNRHAVVNAITLANAITNESPETPVNSTIWMSGHLAQSAMPSPFQPNPPKSHPRIHSWVVYAEARRKASHKLFIDLNHGAVGIAVGALPARSSISLHLSFVGFIFVRPGLTSPQNQLQNAKFIPR